MDTRTYAVPAPLGSLLSALPRYPGSLLFSTGLNLTLQPCLPPDVQAALVGKRLRIDVRDARIGFDFEWKNGRFAACPWSDRRSPDLVIAASAYDFLLLARRQEDPDTLFFSRRLTMEGDTELGLLLKNTLDAIELPVFDLGRHALTRRARRG